MWSIEGVTSLKLLYTNELFDLPVYFSVIDK